MSARSQRKRNKEVRFKEQKRGYEMLTCVWFYLLKMQLKSVVKEYVDCEAVECEEEEGQELCNTDSETEVERNTKVHKKDGGIVTPETEVEKKTKARRTDVGIVTPESKTDVGIVTPESKENSSSYAQINLEDFNSPDNDIELGGNLKEIEIKKKSDRDGKPRYPNHVMATLSKDNCVLFRLFLPRQVKRGPNEFGVRAIRRNSSYDDIRRYFKFHHIYK